jgi:hypothetical protein
MEILKFWKFRKIQAIQEIPISEGFPEFRKSVTHMQTHTQPETQCDLLICTSLGHHKKIEIIGQNQSTLHSLLGAGYPYL